mgnify:CR=1 FL=1
MNSSDNRFFRQPEKNNSPGNLCSEGTAQEEKLKRLLKEYYKKAVHPDLKHNEFEPHWKKFCNRNLI